MSDLEKIKIEVQEDICPYFTDSQLQYYFEKNGCNLNDTIYELLIIKSQSSTISVNGLNTQDTSSYFKRLASRYKNFNSGTLGS